MTNLNSVNELTEFSSLNSETESGVFSKFSKLFRFAEDVSSKPLNPNILQLNPPASPPVKDEYSSHGRRNSSVTQTATKLFVSTPSESVASEACPSSGLRLELRTLPNVLRRMSNMLAIRNPSANSVLYDETHLRKYWMPDSVSKECYDCGERFTAFRRRHHCRVCGQIFCSQCCNREVPGKIIRCSGNLRVCMYCCKVVLSYMQENELTVDLKALQDDLQSKFGDNVLTYEENRAQDSSNSTDEKDVVSEPNRRKISFVYQEENFASNGLSRVTTAKSQNTFSETASLASLLSELMKGNNALPLRDYIVGNVKYETCFTGSDLIDWLISNRKTISRTHSLAIGQVLLDANQIESVEERGSDFVDGSCLYKFCDATLCVPDESPESVSILSPEKTSRISRSGFHLDINITKSTAHISRQSTKTTHVKDKKKFSSFSGSDFTEHVIRDFSDKYLRLRELNSTCWSSVDESNLKTSDEEADTFLFLRDTFDQHIANVVKQLLSLEELPLYWSEIILLLADRALKEIKIDFNQIDICDINHYVQIKKLAGGGRNDCHLVGGLACTKNVAHRDMNTRLTNPRILLLQCAIVYQRMEGRLMSLEPVMMQEQEYLRHVVDRISVLEPNLILVHRNVSRLVQESLNARGITLVLNVKMSVMQRIARCTNADIVTSVDAHIGTTQLGTCRSFYTDKYTLADGSIKTLMFFDGCALSHLGCTIILRGASAIELKKLKRITSSIVSARHNARLEKSFLLDEFAKPPLTATTTTTTTTTTNTFSIAEDRPMGDAHPVGCVVKSTAPDTFNATAENVCDAERSSRIRSDDDDDDADATLRRNNSFRTALRNIALSYSLFIQYNLPYLETESGRRCELRAYFPKDLYSSAANQRNRNSTVVRAESNHQIRCEASTTTTCLGTHPRTANDPSSISKQTIHAFARAKLKDGTTSEEVKQLLAFYRASGGRLIAAGDEDGVNDDAHQGGKRRRHRISKPCDIDWERSSAIDFTDPRNHQRISVLFCSFSHDSNNAPEFCVNPWTVTMDFYGCNDIPLGSFLEKYCFKTSYMCPSETCDTPMLDHERRFVHDGGCLQVTLNEVDALPDRTTRQILLWSVCTACKMSTPISTLSDDSWNLSFAKYLELRFHADQYTSRADVTKTTCRHSLHRDYCQFFYHRNIVASFKYSDILRWEVSLPPKVLKMRPLKLSSQVVSDEVKKWAIMGHEVFSSVLEKLCLLDSDNAPYIQNLKKDLIREQTDFKSEVDDIQIQLIDPKLTAESEIDIPIKELYSLEDEIVAMKKTVAKTTLRWNTVLAKLSTKRREDRQRKTASSDSTENLSCSAASNVIEERAITPPPPPPPPEEDALLARFGKEDVDVCSDEMDLRKATNASISGASREASYLMGCSRTETSEDIRKMFTNKDAASDTWTDLNPYELANAVPQNISQEKISVKSIFSQLLPNTFLSHSSSLTNPVSSEEHYFMNRKCVVPIVVYESEPSSAIAYALSTHYYQSSLADLMKTASADQSCNRNSNTGSSVRKESSERVPGTNCGTGTGTSAESAVQTTTSETEEISSTKSSESPEIENGKARSTKISDAQHIEVHFADAISTFTVKIYFAQQFKEIRDLIFPVGEEAFARSLSRCVPWAAHGGKSGSSFCKTKDDRFILKEMARLEIHPFLEIAPHYFNYIRACCQSQQPTLLVKIVGVYYVKYRNTLTNQTFQSTLLVMENLFYTRDIIRKFDLKGSVRNRLVNTSVGHEGELVLLDENLINMTCVSPLYIYPHSKSVLMRAINNDVLFLASQSVMDYSLLVGLDEISQELVVGIIDYIRTFTWDKKIETMVKKSGILGGQGKLPTIISPDEYKNRFIAAMHKYFIAVPDQWHNFGKGMS